MDFADLDYLIIDGNFNDDTGLNIFYSSCRNMKFNNAQVTFTNFFGCHFENIRSFNSKYYSSGFYNCDVFGASFENSSLINLSINNCSSGGFTFNRVEVDNIIYTPPKKEWHSGYAGTLDTITDNYKRFRVLYQNNGHRREASESYYNERYYELKFLIYGLDPRKFANFYKLYGIKHAVGSFYLSSRNFGSIVTGIVSYLIWGFGERPKRTALFALFIILFYSLIYYNSSIEYLSQSFTNSIYLSVIMFSTLGFGDFDPFMHGNYKLVLASQALLGAFTYGLFIVGYANKSRY